MTDTHSRRRFVRGGLALVLGAAASRPAWSSMRPPTDRSDEIARLAFVNTHTGESLDVVYREGPRYLGDALAEIDRVLRDHRSGDVHEIDRALLDQLVQLRARLDVGKRPFHVISGYRSPRTNAMLASRSSGVASRSLHLQGRAIDIRMPGVDLADVHRAALSMQAGGVGYYARSDFVHLDTGRVRRW
ncbi:MAG: Twin-arginine translocation pathway signal [Burkholderiales bacterium]|jgi:uncharacterized protein YcbK (DUF882 family)|nr:MAG: Twin-arginine translocation pathway signal [Burkholderiales bacterium]